MENSKLIETKIAALFNAFTKRNTTETAAFSHSLFSGDLGGYLFQFYYLNHRQLNDKRFEDELATFLEEELQSDFQSSSLAHGLTGFAWFLNHLNTENFAAIDHELLCALDEAVYQSAARNAEAGNHDYMHGLLGKLFYFSERIVTEPSVKEKTAELLNRLIELGTFKNNKLHWKEPQHQLTQDETGKDVVYLHTSHGQTGKIMVLAKLAPYFTVAKSALESAVRYFLTVKENGNEKYPYRIVNGTKDYKTHKGWCRGNLTMGLALLKAADVLNNAAYKKEAEQIGLTVLKEIDNESYVALDTGLCHGKAGITLLLQHYATQTKHPLFEQAAAKALQTTLAAGNNNGGVCGYQTYDGVANVWKNDFSLLTGVAGIGLSLISYLSNKPLPWDGFLLLK